MPNRKPRFSREDVSVIDEKVVFDGFFKMHEITLNHRLFAGGWSSEISREVFHRGEACAAVLYDPNADRIGLVEQFRIGTIDSEFGPWCMEAVAGMIEEGESADEMMMRELEEEAGISDAELIHICSYFSSPGGCSEKIHLYCALCELPLEGGLHGLDVEDEDILLHLFPADEAFAVMLDSRMNNAATLLGLQWLQINRKSLRGK